MSEFIGMLKNAAELREALEIYDRRFVEGKRDAYLVSTMRLADAARTIALPILEADPELVERIAGAIVGYYWDAEKVTDEHDREAAREVLAAISTPTPVEELNGH